MTEGEEDEEMVVVDDDDPPGRVTTRAADAGRRWVTAAEEVDADADAEAVAVGRAERGRRCCRGWC